MGGGDHVVRFDREATPVDASLAPVPLDLERQLRRGKDRPVARDGCRRRLNTRSERRVELGENLREPGVVQQAQDAREEVRRTAEDRVLSSEDRGLLDRWPKARNGFGRQAQHPRGQERENRCHNRPGDLVRALHLRVSDLARDARAG